MTSGPINESSDSSTLSGNLSLTENVLESEQVAGSSALTTHTTSGEDWDYFDIFKELLGQDPEQTFWDIFPHELNIETAAE